ncbi:hypothetical protein [Fimbriiglobus ruber]|uniref:hypothetical protein n=1 Tax=Fimbriiglobus ruber TaxID=1908690 RepID=UPI003B84A305
MAGYAGFVHADGVRRDPLVQRMTHRGRSHVRRKFFDAWANHPAEAREAVAYIRTPVRRRAGDRRRRAGDRRRIARG